LLQNNLSQQIDTDSDDAANDNSYMEQKHNPVITMANLEDIEERENLILHPQKNHIC
jgi:hypothetical protein